MENGSCLCIISTGTRTDRYSWKSRMEDQDGSLASGWGNAEAMLYTYLEDLMERFPVELYVNISSGATFGYSGLAF